MTEIFTAIAAFFNSAIGFAILWAAIVGAFTWFTSKYNPFNEAWHKYEGTIITAVRFAENAIPDGTENKGLAKLDWALQYVIKAYEEANNGKSPSETMIAAFKEGIQIKHDQLDRFGILGK